MESSANIKYHIKLREDYKAATGDESNILIEDIINWHRERLYLVKNFGIFLLDINLIYNIFTNFAEVGKVGGYNSISAAIKPATVISPFASTLNSGRGKIYRYNGKLLYEGLTLGIERTINDGTIFPKVRGIANLILHNPDFTPDEQIPKTTLTSLQYASWIEEQTIIIGIYGHKDDKDLEEKIKNLEICKQQILGIGEMLYDEDKKNMESIKAMLEEREETYDDGTYVKILMTNPYIKQDLLNLEKTRMQYQKFIATLY